MRNSSINSSDVCQIPVDENRFVAILVVIARAAGAVVAAVGAVAAVQTLTKQVGTTMEP